MSYDCYCDNDPPSFYKARIVKAKTRHVCDECGRPILMGESHEYAFGTYGGGENYTPRTCSHCLDIRRFVANNIPCFCWAHGGMLDAAHECVEDAYVRAGDEVRGVRFGLGRLFIKARRAAKQARLAA